MTVIITRMCRGCGEEFEICVDTKEFDAVLANQPNPDPSRDSREIIARVRCSECRNEGDGGLKDEIPLTSEQEERLKEIRARVAEKKAHYKFNTSTRRY